MRELRSVPWVLVVVAAQFLVMLDSSILNVALPSIADGMSLSPLGSAWILNAYFLTFGGFLLVAGRAADVIGRRRMFCLGAALLAAGAVVGLVTASEWVLVASRLVQGLGAAALSPAAMSVILAGTSGRVRAAAMSAWGAASALAGATGVSVGGMVTAAFGWRAVFGVTATVAILVLVAGWRMLPADAARARRSFDAAGAVLVTVAATAAVWTVLTVPAAGASSLGVITGGAVALAALVAFVLRERRAADPVLPLVLLRDVRVSGGLVVNLLGGAARIACFFMVALLLQQVLAFEPGVAGLAMLPTSVAGFAVTTLALPRLLGRFGPERVVVAGLGLLAVAHALLASGAAMSAADVAGGGAYWVRVLPALLLASAGVAMSFTPTTLVISSGVPAERSGVASGLASSSAQLGGALGIAVFSAIDAAARLAGAGAGSGAGADAAGADAAGVGMSAAFAAAAVTAAAAAVLAAVWFVRPTLAASGAARRAEAARLREAQSALSLVARHPTSSPMPK